MPLFSSPRSGALCATLALALSCLVSAYSHNALAQAQTPSQSQTQPVSSRTAASQPATSQPDAAASDEQPVATLTTGQIQSHLDVLTADTSLDPAMREQAAQMYRTALSRLQAANASQQAALKYRQLAQNSQAQINAVQLKLKALQGQATSDQSTDENNTQTTQPSTQPTSQPATLLDDAIALDQLSLDALEEKLATKHFDESALRGDLAALQSNLAQMAQRPADARKELIEARQKLVTLDRTQLEETAGEQTIVTQATRVLLTASRIYWPARINELEQELVSLPDRRELLTAKRRLIESQLVQIQRQAKALAQSIDQKRQSLATQHTRQAKAQAQAMDQRRPILENFAKQTAVLGEQLTQLSRELTLTRTQHEVAQAQLQKVQAFVRNADQILDIGAAGETFGQLLVTLRAKLPDIEKIHSGTTHRQQSIVQARLNELDLQSQQDALRDPHDLLKTLLAQQAQPNNTATTASLTEDDRATFANLVQARTQVIDLLLELQSNHVDALMEVNGLEKQLIEITHTLSDRLDEKLIWLPSLPRVDIHWFKEIGQGIAWIFNPKSWLITAKALGSSATRYPITSLLMLVIVGLIFYHCRRMNRKVSWIAEQVGNVSTDSFVFTPQVLLITLVLALPWAILIAFPGWLLGSEPNHLRFTQATGRGLLAAGVLLGLLQTFAIMCRENGLFGAHFRWHATAREVLGKNLRWLIVVECVAGFFVAATQSSDSDLYRSGLGRLAFLLGSIGLSVFIYRVFHLRKGIVANMLSQRSWMWRSRGLWFTLLVVSPLILAVFAMLGYYQTASMIQSRLFTTAWIILIGLIFYSLGMRSVVVAHRRLAVKRAREARDKAREARETNKEAQESGEAMPHMLDLPDVDLSSVSDQTRTLLRWLTVVAVGVILWMLWSQLVPALSVLKDITLWNGIIVTSEGPQAMPITLLAVLAGLLTAAMTFVAARNLPGLLEMTALSRLSIDSGTRYAISAISRYIIIVVGLLIAFDQVGIQWSKMQWIVAALGVGLGFGLQEIVANFVSGMIILFERPVRVGDTVTVNNLSGTISRIQIRATTIVDWDNREILVPNKSFITEQVVNWTLSDPVTRLVMKVGIAYGSDTALAHKLMMQVVKANPMVLDTPAPTIFFLGFGDSSLDFDVRIFVSELSKRMPVLHELHMSINQIFAENNIEIPFPQRDLHIRSSDVPWPTLEAGKPAEPASGSDQESNNKNDAKHQPDHHHDTSDGHDA